MGLLICVVLSGEQGIVLDLLGVCEEEGPGGCAQEVLIGRGALKDFGMLENVVNVLRSPSSITGE